MDDSRIPPRPSLQNEHQWEQLSAEQQAAAIHEWQDFWLGCSAPSATGVSGVSFAPLSVQAPSAPFDSTEGSGIGRQQMHEDAETELREAHRIRNQGL